MPKFTFQFTVPVCPALPLSVCEVLHHSRLEEVRVQVNVSFFVAVRGSVCVFCFIFVLLKRKYR